MRALSRRKALQGICAVTGFSILSGCAVNPVTGKRELMLMSEQKELSMGKQAHGEIVASYGSYDDDSLQSWFNERGQEMAAVTHRKNLQYSFTVLDSPVVNAFAVPGGYVYVTRGILGYFNNEGQFAGVLGHELGHVNARHTAKRYSKAQLANLTLGIGSIFSEEFARYAQLASLGASLLFLKYSRDDERQADSLGVEYSSSVGYNAVEMSTFFHTLERMHPAGGSLPEWQSTHPDPGDRVKATRQQALKFQQAHQEKEFVIRRDEYLDSIDGMIFGDDPRQGYVKDNVFYHPEMKFMFPVPVGWNLTNSPTEVRIAPEKNNAMLIFTSVPGETPQSAATQFATENNVTITGSSPITINGMNGFHTTGHMSGNESEYAIASYFIKKEDSIYAFHGLSTPSDAGAFTANFTHVATGFNTLTDQALLNVSPEIIQIRTTDGTVVLSKIFADNGVSEDRFDELAILNGMELDDIIQTGTGIKIIA